MRILSFLFLFGVSHLLSAQPDFSSLPRVDSIYQDYIKTIEFYNASDELSMPIINQETGVLSVDFDDHYGEYIDYYYTVIHCDRNWNYTEDVEISEYLNGPDVIQIEDFGSSISTNISYMHYGFDFPNADINFRWTGNYMLIVYDSDNTVAFSRRFYVINEVVNFLFPKYVRPNGVGQFDTHQAFTFELGIKRLDPINPLNELYVTGFQNRLNERPLDFEQPFRINGTNAVFDIGNQFSFYGYKEYREFDTRTILTGLGRGINSVDVSNTNATVMLDLDKNRSPKAHFALRESNGAFVTRNTDRTTGDKNMTAEYVNTIFTLRSPIEEEADVYLLGEFNDFKAYPQYRMRYQQSQGIYTVEVPLKQGYYNYMYGTVDKNEAPDFLRFEGSSFETENRYHFFVYYRPLSGVYDQLVGYLNYPHQPR